MPQDIPDTPLEWLLQSGAVPRVACRHCDWIDPEPPTVDTTLDGKLVLLGRPCPRCDPRRS